MLRTVSGTDVGRIEIIRMPSDIRAEIDRVNERIAALSAKIDIREMLGDMLALADVVPEEDFIAEVEDMISVARESLDELIRLKNSLEILACELEESRWITGF